MKKIRLFFAVIVLLAFPGTVMSQAFDMGDNVLSGMLGIGGHYGIYSSYTTVTPGFGISYEHGLQVEAGSGVIGVGGYVGYKSLGYKKAYLGNYVYDYRWTYIIVGARGAYHYDLFGVEELDTYGGLMFAANILSTEDKSTYPSGYDDLVTGNTYPSVTLFVGGRYYFTESIGGLMEIGYGISYLSFGLSFKL